MHVCISDITDLIGLVSTAVQQTQRLYTRSLATSSLPRPTSASTLPQRGRHDGRKQTGKTGKTGFRHRALPDDARGRDESSRGEFDGGEIAESANEGVGGERVEGCV